MTNAERIALLNAAILAVRPHGHLAESVLIPIQTVRDDLSIEAIKSAPADETPKPHVPDPA